MYEFSNLLFRTSIFNCYVIVIQKVEKEDNFESRCVRNEQKFKYCGCLFFLLEKKDVFVLGLWIYMFVVSVSLKS